METKIKFFDPETDNLGYQWWTPEAIQQLKELYEERPATECAKIMGRTYHSVRSAIKKFKMQGGIQYVVWDKATTERLVDLYPNTKNIEIAEILSVRETAILSKAFTLRLKKTPEFMKECSEKGYFQKGHVPANKGKDCRRYVTEKSKARQFKNGQLPHNTLEDGAITIRIDKRGAAHRFIRIDKGKWVSYTRHTYEKYFGPIPKGMCVRYKDKDSLNDDPDNLELITQKENRLRNAGWATLTDNYVAQTIATKNNPGLKEALLKHPQLIDIKRAQLQLNRILKSQTNDNSNNSIR